MCKGSSLDLIAVNTSKVKNLHSILGTDDVSINLSFRNLSLAARLSSQNYDQRVFKATNIQPLQLFGGIDQILNGF